MKRVLFALVTSVLVYKSCQAQTDPVSGRGFRELLEIAEIKPETLSETAVTDGAGVDWKILTPILLQLQQQSEIDLRRWTVSQQKFTSEHVGELFEVEGTLLQVDPLPLPPGISELLETKQAYLCQFMDGNSRRHTVITLKIPRGWILAKQLNEPISFRGVLIQSGDQASFLATHLRWFPTAGLSSGKLLLARHGMDAGLWDDVVQRSRFISPDKAREAEAFYAAMAAISTVPPSEFTQLAIEGITRQQFASDSVPPKLQQQLEASIAEQSELGLSSFAALYLEPQERVGELVRIEGVARRAIRIAVNEDNSIATRDPIREYFEVEVFTADSQNLPLVCCITSLPEGFPIGDEIHAQVRVEGVFFKSWQYRSRTIVAAQGETATQQQRYTPVIIAASLTWLHETPARANWWGLGVGATIFAAMIFGLLRMAMTLKQERRGRVPSTPPDFSQL